MANINPNTSEIVRLKKLESDSKKHSVLKALEELILLDDPINNPITKSSVCCRAGVSKTFLYSYKKELIEPINIAIKNQNNKMKIISQKPAFTEISKDKVIDSLKRRMKNIEEENRRLKHDNAILLGKLAQK